MNGRILSICVFGGLVLPTSAQAEQPASRPTTAVARADLQMPKGPRGHLKIGEPAPSFRIRATDGALIRLDEIAYDGRDKRYAPKRPVLIDFFRTDCVPCIKAMPELIELHKQHKAAGLEVLLIALLEDERGNEKLDDYLSTKALPFTVAKDTSSYVCEKFMGRVVSLPATFLIDRNGILRKTKFDGRGRLSDHFGSTLATVLAEHRKASAK